MRFVNAAGRAGVLVDGRVHDLATISGGAISSDPMVVIREQWDDARAATATGATGGGVAVEDVALGPPVPAPHAVFAVAKNYRAHAEETGSAPSELPGIFTKYPTSINGPFGAVVLPAGRDQNDWEAELAFVVDGAGRHVDAGDAWDHVLGFLCAQDISERYTQFAAGGQFNMGKSYDTFCPLGPALVTLDELADPTDLRIQCRINGRTTQDARTSELIFDIPALVAFLSSVCTLRAGDVCLTGTPAGVGMASGTYLRDGDVIETEIEGVGLLRNRCVAERR
jgi:2-keto-4-pentenoate hydratase/2-oxohepta-3-ene-1,7-dioic acid hydratase in catechol pathway